jgi:hypothetical protein
MAPLFYLGPDFCNHTKLGFKGEEALARSLNAIGLMCLRKMNRMATRLLQDTIFDHQTKETAVHKSAQNEN